MRGIGGIGKTTLAAKLIDRPGVEFDANPLVIRCNELAQPVDALGKIASFWQAQGIAGHAEAAAHLLDSRRDPADRAREALQSIGDRRYLIVFDNLESWLETDSEQLSVISDQTVRDALRGLLAANARTTLVFTGRHRWAGFEALPPQNRLEIHLPELTLRQAILLMNAQPRLAGQPLADKLAAIKRIGGHPKTIELLDGWLADGRSLRALLDDPSLSGKLAEEWEAYFLNDLLARLTPAGRDALTTLAILEEPFWWQMARDLLPPPLTQSGEGRGGGQGRGEGEVQALLTHFLDLSLIQYSHTDKDGDAWYTLHPVVRDYLLNGLDDAQRRDLHVRAAAYYGAPFVEEARQAALKSGKAMTHKQIGALARSRQGVVGVWVEQTQYIQHARVALNRAMHWQRHLFQSGQFDAASEIVTAVIPVLHRLGLRDLAKSLLRSSIHSLTDEFSSAVAQGNLANILTDEGYLLEALTIQEHAYDTFAKQNTKRQMAASLSRLGDIHTRMGKHDRAIAKQEASLQIYREISVEEGQAISLHQLSMLYRLKEDYNRALALSHEAEALNRKLNRQEGIVANLHEQGLIYYRLNRPQDAFERFSEGLRVSRYIGDESGVADTLGELGRLYRDAGTMREAFAAFNESLEIRQRLGDPKMGISLENLGLVHELQGEYVPALEKYQQALSIFQQVGMANEARITQQDITRVKGKMGK